MTGCRSRCTVAPPHGAVLTAEAVAAHPCGPDPGRRRYLFRRTRSVPATARRTSIEKQHMVITVFQDSPAHHRPAAVASPSINAIPPKAISPRVPRDMPSVYTPSHSSGERTTKPLPRHHPHRPRAGRHRVRQPGGGRGAPSSVRPDSRGNSRRSSAVRPPGRGYVCLNARRRRANSRRRLARVAPPGLWRRTPLRARSAENQGGSRSSTTKGGSRATGWRAPRI